MKWFAFFSIAPYSSTRPVERIAWTVKVTSHNCDPLFPYRAEIIWLGIIFILSYFWVMFMKGVGAGKLNLHFRPIFSQPKRVLDSWEMSFVRFRIWIIYPTANHVQHLHREFIIYLVLEAEAFNGVFLAFHSRWVMYLTDRCNADILGILILIVYLS